ncbi:hypothetical protein BLNAU_17094 [Blattamonas nauphoetae]|uniref:Uncharacterized protein n=1 Tax=Blattamonas nauphoetae TaxID=2049346 RepID=A0ABQ9X9U2_9EUKA|nr:hypothetical protein BLNAU_17094 [Blattamonas nauphoetae]
MSEDDADAQEDAGEVEGQDGGEEEGNEPDEEKDGLDADCEHEELGEERFESEMRESEHGELEDNQNEDNEEAEDEGDVDSELSIQPEDNDHGNMAISDGEQANREGEEQEGGHIEQFDE